MKRRILEMICVAVLSAGLLAGCGSEEKDHTAAQETSSNKEEAAEKEEEIKKETSEETKEETGEEVNSADESEEELFTDDTETLGEEDSESAKTGSDDLQHAKIVVKDYGTIEVDLDAETAPITVENFVNLAKSGFYDGLTFHRIMEGFMIQGGDPNGNGTGGSEKKIKGEFESNGVKNDLSHKRGVISMARSMDPDSASSQFFIMHADAPYLDGEYAAFGTVTEGMDVVDAICEDAKPVDDNGTIPKDEQPVIESITIE